MSSNPRGPREREGDGLLRDVTNHVDATARPLQDWATNIRTYGWMWGLPIAAIVAGLFIDVRLRTVIWTAALLVMGTACVLNARRCGRTHCQFTGPYYLVMIPPALALGLGAQDYRRPRDQKIARTGRLRSILKFAERARGHNQSPAHQMGQDGQGRRHSAGIGPEPNYPLSRRVAFARAPDFGGFLQDVFELGYVEGQSAGAT